MEEVAVDPLAPPTKIGGVNPERWLQSVQSEPSDGVPPSFSSLNLGSDESGPKALATKEDNMKYPTSMKSTPRSPESRAVQPQQPYFAPREDQIRRSSEGSRQLAVPRLITSDGREPVVHHPDSSSDEDDDHAHSSLRPPEKGLIIRTSDLVDSSKALMLSPSESNYDKPWDGSFGPDSTPRTIMPEVEYGTSPNWRDQVPDTLLQNMRTSNNHNVKLAPDQYGREIPPDAKWTKVNRRLVSTEVLDQDGRRYEA